MFLLLSLLLLVGGSQSDSPSTIVTGLWAQYADRLVRQDIDGLANLYTIDARLMEPNVDDLVGRAIIRERLKAVLSQNIRTVDLRVVPREVVGHASGAVIFDQGDLIETFAQRADPRRVVDFYARYSAVWAQQPDGTWKLARLMISPKKQPTR